LEELTIFVTRKDGGELPEYATPASAGMDLTACIDAPITLGPMQRTLVPTGIHVGIPEGFEAEIRPRSGLAHRHGVTVLNSPGTIDSDYRGEVKVILINLGEEPFVIEKGDRIAQMIVKPVVRAALRLVEELPPTLRGQGGFGSTGR
jgi:dUTP pyrophosphatase